MDISFWLEANKSVLQACAAVATCAGVAGGMLGHHITKTKLKQEFKRGKLRSVVEIIGVEPRYEGGEIILDFTSNGEQQTLEKLLAGLATLQGEIIDATKKVGNGIFLRLPKPESHRQMMEIIEDAITGLDPNANVAARAGRAVNLDGEFFCPTFHADSNGVQKVRIYVVNDKLMQLIGDKRVRMKPAKKRWEPMVAVLLRIKEASAGTFTPGSGGTSVVWHAVNKTPIDVENTASCLDKVPLAA